MNDIKAGDVVVLKSGSIEMTVAKVYDREALCIWYSESTDTMLEKEIPLIAIAKSESELEDN